MVTATEIFSNDPTADTVVVDKSVDITGEKPFSLKSGVPLEFPSAGVA